MRVIEDGGIVAIPTDTLYGLATRALDESAVRRVFDLKGRPEGMALPLLVAQPEDIEDYAVEVPDVAWALVERFMPGALTVVLRKASCIPDIVTAGRDTVAMRIPLHSVPRAIVRELGEPITGTSANHSGGPGPTTAEAVRAQLGDGVDLLIDGGKTLEGSPSTVVDLSGDVPRVLRQGAISAPEIEAVCGQKVVASP